MVPAQQPAALVPYIGELFTAVDNGAVSLASSVAQLYTVNEEAKQMYADNLDTLIKISRDPVWGGGVSYLFSQMSQDFPAKFVPHVDMLMEQVGHGMEQGGHHSLRARARGAGRY